MKLRIYNQCESELAAFGNLDNPDLYYEFYPDSYPGRRGKLFYVNNGTTLPDYMTVFNLLRDKFGFNTECNNNS